MVSFMCVFSVCLRVAGRTKEAACIHHRSQTRHTGGSVTDGERSPGAERERGSFLITLFFEADMVIFLAFFPAYTAVDTLLGTPVQHITIQYNRSAVILQR